MFISVAVTWEANLELNDTEKRSHAAVVVDDDGLMTGDEGEGFSVMAW